NPVAPPRRPVGDQARRSDRLSEGMEAAEAPGGEAQGRTQGSQDERPRPPAGALGRAAVAVRRLSPSRGYSGDARVRGRQPRGRRRPHPPRLAPGRPPAPSSPARVPERPPPPPRP